MPNSKRDPSLGLTHSPSADALQRVADEFGLGIGTRNQLLPSGSLPTGLYGKFVDALAERIEPLLVMPMFELARLALAYDIIRTQPGAVWRWIGWRCHGVSDDELFGEPRAATKEKQSHDIVTVYWFWNDRPDPTATAPESDPPDAIRATLPLECSHARFLGALALARNAEKNLGTVWIGWQGGKDGLSDVAKAIGSTKAEYRFIHWVKTPADSAEMPGEAGPYAGLFAGELLTGRSNTWLEMERMGIAPDKQYPVTWRMRLERWQEAYKIWERDSTKHKQLVHATANLFDNQYEWMVRNRTEQSLDALLRTKLHFNSFLSQIFVGHLLPIKQSIHRIRETHKGWLLPAVIYDGKYEQHFIQDEDGKRKRAGRGIERRVRVAWTLRCVTCRDLYSFTGCQCGRLPPLCYEPVYWYFVDGECYPRTAYRCVGDRDKCPPDNKGRGPLHIVNSTNDPCPRCGMSHWEPKSTTVWLRGIPPENYADPDHVDPSHPTKSPPGVPGEDDGDNGGDDAIRKTADLPSRSQMRQGIRSAFDQIEDLATLVLHYKRSRLTVEQIPDEHQRSITLRILDEEYDDRRGDFPLLQ